MTDLFSKYRQMPTANTGQALSLMIQANQNQDRNMTNLGKVFDSQYNRMAQAEEQAKKEARQKLLDARTQKATAYSKSRDTKSDTFKEKKFKADQKWRESQTALEEKKIVAANETRDLENQRLKIALAENKAYDLSGVNRSVAVPIKDFQSTLDNIKDVDILGSNDKDVVELSKLRFQLSSIPGSEDLIGRRRALENKLADPNLPNNIKDIYYNNLKTLDTRISTLQSGELAKPLNDRIAQLNEKIANKAKVGRESFVKEYGYETKPLTAKEYGKQLRDTYLSGVKDPYERNALQKQINAKVSAYQSKLDQPRKTSDEIAKEYLMTKAKNKAAIEGKIDGGWNVNKETKSLEEKIKAAKAYIKSINKETFTNDDEPKYQKAVELLREHDELKDTILPTIGSTAYPKE